MRSDFRRLSAHDAKKIKPELAAVIAVNVLVCVFFIVLNFNTGWYVDDYGYMYVFTLEGKLSSQRVGSVADVVRSQYAHYFLMNGRTVAHTLLQTVLIGGKWLFNIVNTLFYLALGIVCYIMVKPRDRHSPLAQLAVYALPWFAYPDFSLVHLLACTAANYLWMMTVIMTFLLPFALLYRGNDIFRRKKALGAVIMALGGLIAGWCSENGSAAMLFAIGCMGLYYLIARKRIPAWCFTGFAGAIAGFTMMLLSPGYKIRSSGAAQSSAALSPYERLVRILIDHLLPYFWYILAALLCAVFVVLAERNISRVSRLRCAGRCCLAAVGAWLLLLVIGKLSANSAKAPAVYAVTQLVLIVCCFAALVIVVARAHGKIPAEPLVLIAAGIAANIAMIAVPVFQTRSEWPFFVMAVVCAGLELALPALDALAQTLPDRIITKRVAEYCAAAVLAVVMASSLTVTVRHTCDFYQKYLAREKYMSDRAAAGESGIMLPDMQKPEDDRVVYFYPGDQSPDYWINQAIRQYYSDTDK